jgi:hypothetical protein
MAAMVGCGPGGADLPTRGRVWIEAADGRFVPVPGVLVVAQRINVCDHAASGTGSTWDIDAHIKRTNSDGAVDLPPGTYPQVCSRVILRTEAFKPGYESKGGRAFLHFHPEAAGQGIKGDDALLVPSRMDESRGIQLVNSFAFGSSATTDMRKQAYLEMLPDR